MCPPGHGHNKGALHAVELLFSGCSCTADADAERREREREKKMKPHKKSHSPHSHKKHTKGKYETVCRQDGTKSLKDLRRRK